jgi:hypothetical protein
MTPESSTSGRVDHAAGTAAATDAVVARVSHANKLQPIRLPLQMQAWLKAKICRLPSGFAVCLHLW